MIRRTLVLLLLVVWCAPAGAQERWLVYGGAYVIRAGGTFEVIGRNSLNEFTMATPAIAHGSLFIRTRSTLYRIAEAAAP